MIRAIGRIDRDRRWSAYSSKWSYLEVARALKKDGKTPEVIALDLQELRSHNITFQSVTDELIINAEKLVGTSSLYAADSLHVSTFLSLNKTYTLDGFVCDDMHYERLKPYVPVIKLNQLRV